MSPPPATLPAVSFTYAGDALAVRPWCLCARAVGLVPVIADDAHHPLPPWVAGWLAAEGIWHFHTPFPRRGNLNGTDTAAAILGYLAAVADTLAAPGALKLDIDTAVIRPRIFLRPSLSGHLPPAVGLTAPPDRPDAYGMAYWVRPDAARLAAAHLAALPLDPTAPEDVSVWRALLATHPHRADRPVPLHFRPDAGPFSAVPPHIHPAAAAARFDVLTFGNSDSLHPRRTRLARALQALAIDIAPDIDRPNRHCLSRCQLAPLPPEIAQLA